MPLIAMNREIGSLGKDVAKGLSQLLGCRVQHHEMVDHLANRARVRKSHVVSFLDGAQGMWERLTVDDVKLRILTADEIVSAAENNEAIVLRGWGATSLLKEVPHAIRVCVSASRRAPGRRRDTRRPDRRAQGCRQACRDCGSRDARCAAPPARGAAPARPLPQNARASHV